MPFLAELLNPPDEQQAFDYAKSIVDSDNSLVGLDDLTSRKHELESKLALSSSSLDAALNAARSDLASHYSNVLSLSQTRDELDESSQTHAYITNSTPSLLQDLETLLAKLTELEHLRSYVSVIHHALDLSEKAVNDVRSFLDEEANAPRTVSNSTLKSFSEMQTYIASFRELSIQQDGELSLSTFLGDLQRRTWSKIRGLLSDQLLAASEKIQWPKPVPYASFPQETRVTFELAFLNLLHLQELGEKAYTPSQRERLYPLSTLILPIAQRFKYHFDTSNRPTNRIDKPEWFMTHILNVTHEHKDFIDGVVKHLIGRSAFKEVDVKDEWISLLLPLVRRKLRMVVGQCITADPPRLGLVAHAVQQALVFDKQIEEEEGYGNSEDDRRWGVSWEVLGRSEWFEIWVDGERDFANDQYNNIVSSPDAWTLQPSSSSTSTVSSTRLTSLLTSSTLPYTPLPLTHQPPFLLNVTLPLLEMYHDRIKGSLDAFDTLSGVFGSMSMSIPGQMGVGGEMTRGVEGVGKVVKGWVSAGGVRAFVGRWEEEIFFIELWQHILDSGITHRLLPEGEGLGENGVFGVILSMYDALQGRAEEIIIRQIAGEVEAGMKEWFNWQYEMMSHPSETEAEETELTQPLLAALQILLTHLSALPDSLRQRIYAPLASSITSSIMKKSPVLQRHRRTTLEAGRAFKRDVDALVDVVVRSFGRGRVWRVLEDVGMCVSLEGEKFEKAEELAWGSGEEWRDDEGVMELDRESVRSVLRCREESKY